MDLDLLITGARLVDVETLSVRPADVGISGERIAFVGDPGTGPRAERVINAGGAYLAPGLFDAHSHTDLYYNPAVCTDAFVVRGITGVFSDNHDCAAALGPQAYEKLLDAARNFNLRYFAGAPAAMPPYPGLEGRDLYTTEEFRRVMSRPDVISTGEIEAWPLIVDGDPRLLERLRIIHDLGKRAEGHTVGATPEKLKTLARAGITSCHESLSPKDVEDRLDAGLWVMIRESSIRTDLDRLAPYIASLPPEKQGRICLVTDGVFPGDLIARGALDNTVRRAAALGLPPIMALCMATLNPARYFGLDRDLGRVAEGCLADIVLFEDLEDFKAKLVLVGGRVMAEDGRLVVPPGVCPDLGLGDRPFTLARRTADDFELEPPENGSPTVPVIGIMDQTITLAEEMEIVAGNGRLEVPRRDDLMRAFLISRDGTHTGACLMRGYGASVGGLASSIAHETQGLLVVGNDPADMAAALDTVVAMKGGLAVVEGGREMARVELPLGGIMSAGSLEETHRHLSMLEDLLRSRGAPWAQPVLPLVFMTFTSILHYRLTYSGVYDVRRRRVVYNGAAIKGGDA